MATTLLVAILTLGSQGDLAVALAPILSDRDPPVNAAQTDLITESSVTLNTSDPGPDGVWSPVTSPSPRIDGQMVYDPIGDRYFLFGGSAEDDPPLRNDLWVMSASARGKWVLVPVNGSRPQGRWGHSAVFDTEAQQILLFGGHVDQSSALDNDVWSFSIASLSWTKLTISGVKPLPRAQQSACFDPNGRRLFVAFGSDGINHLSDVWELDLISTPVWSQVAPSAPGPVGRRGASLVYDPDGGFLYSFGGQSETSTNLNDLWRLDIVGNMLWERMSPGQQQPQARAYHCSGFARGSGTLVIFGGKGSSWLNDIWSYSVRSASPSWSQIFPTTSGPHPRSSAGNCWDERRSQLLVFGGFAGNVSNPSNRMRADMWALSMSSLPMWQPLNGTEEFLGRSRAMAFPDPSTGALIICGGLDASTSLADTWLHRSTAEAGWSFQEYGFLGNRFDAAVTATDLDSNVFLFGGARGCISSGCYLNDLRKYSLTARHWSTVTVPGPIPAGRFGHSLAYDSLHSRLVLFGGQSASAQNLNDVWLFDLLAGTWRNVPIGGIWPAARLWHASAVDPIRHRMWIFGGVADSPVYQNNELWYLDLALEEPSWVHIITPPFLPRPAPRSQTSLVYDPIRDRLIVFGGAIGAAPNRTNDVWELTLSSQPTWRQLSLEGDLPSRRSGHVAAYDALEGRMIIATGYDGFDREDAWALQFGELSGVGSTSGNTHSNLLKLASIWPNPGSHRIHFSISNQTGLPAEVFVVSTSGRVISNIGVTSAEGEWVGEWDGLNEAGREVASGTYFLFARNSKGVTSERVVLVR